VRILVTAGRSPGALDLIRRLAKFQHKVYVAESALINLAAFSQNCEKVIRVAPPRQQLNRYLSDLNQIIERENIDLVIPTYEEAYFVAKIKDQLKAEVYIASIELLKNLHNKYEFVQLQQGLGIPTPLSYLVSSQIGVSEYLSKSSRDYVLKPVFSRYGEQVLVGNEKIKNNLNQIEISDQYRWILQEKIIGKEYCTYSLCSNGKVMATVIYPKDINDWNVSICFDRVRNAKIEQWINSIVQKINFTGQIGFDLFLTPDGEVKACECNPRMTSGIHLINEEQDLVNIIQGSENEQFDPQKKWLSAIGVIEAIKKHRLLKDLSSYHDVLFDIYDMAPFLIGQHVSFLYQVILAQKLKLSITQATTHDIEWNGE
jgi:predicted ATP-grasp superfamily ATP-dependent carboligase